MFQPVRICLICSQFYPIIGGTERQVQRLAEKLALTGQPVFVLTTQPGAAPSQEMINGVPIYRYLPGGFGGGRIASLCRTIELVAREMYFLFRHRRKYDIIHAQQAFYLTIGAIIMAKLLGKKVIFKIGCGGEMGDLALNSQSKIGTLNFKVLRSADAFVAISNQIEAELLAFNFTREKIIKIPNGVDLELFLPVAPEAKLDLKKKLGLPSKDIIVSVTRTDRQKRPDILLSAWNEVLKQLPGLHLVFIVSNAAAECERLTKENYCPPESITYKCRINNVEQYLQASEMFIINSLFEGLPNAVLEAMACELPVIGTAVGGTTDIIADRQTGILVDPNNATALAAAIVSLYKQKELRLSLAKKGRELIKDKFSLDKVATQYIELYRRIVA